MSKKVTNADLVRNRIATAIVADESAEIVVTWAVETLGMTKQLAKVYAKNLWPQVAKKLETPEPTPAIEAPVSVVIDTPIEPVAETPVIDPVAEAVKAAKASKRKAKAAKKAVEPVTDTPVIEAAIDTLVAEIEEDLKEDTIAKVISFDEEFIKYDDGADLIAGFNEDYGSFSMN